MPAYYTHDTLVYHGSVMNWRSTGQGFESRQDKKMRVRPNALACLYSELGLISIIIIINCRPKLLGYEGED